MFIVINCKAAARPLILKHAEIQCFLMEDGVSRCIEKRLYKVVIDNRFALEHIFGNISVCE